MGKKSKLKLIAEDGKITLFFPPKLFRKLLRKLKSRVQKFTRKLTLHSIALLVVAISSQLLIFPSS